MTQPRVDRPHMPGYGVAPPGEGTGLLPWSWATERLGRAHDYWLATVGLEGRPHLMPVWAVWDADALWFSSSTRSRKVRNLRGERRCSIATDDAQEPVVVDGVAEVVEDRRLLERVLELENAKYETTYTFDELFDPSVSTCFRLRPVVAFGLVQADFSGSPTRWTFD